MVGRETECMGGRVARCVTVSVKSVRVNVGTCLVCWAVLGECAGPVSCVLPSWVFPAHTPEFCVYPLFCVTGMVLPGHLPVSWL